MSATINVLNTLTPEQIKGMGIYGQLTPATRLDRDKLYLFSAEELAEVPEDTVIFKNPDLNQELTIKDVLSMYFEEGTIEFLVDETVGEKAYKMIPLGKGIRVKEIVDAAGKFPTGFKLLDTDDAPVVAGATKGYIESDSEAGEARKAGYAQAGIDITKDAFPLLIPKSKRKPVTDPENWKVTMRTIVSALKFD